MPVLFELCFVAVLALLLLSAQKDLDQLRHSKEAILALRRNQALGLAIGYDVATSFGEQSSLTLDRLDKMRAYLTRPDMVLGVPIELFPEVKDLTQKSEAICRDMMALVERTGAIMNQPESPGRDKGTILSIELAHHQSILVKVMMETMPLTKGILAIEERVQSMEPKRLAQFKTTLAVVIGSGLLLSCLVSLGLAALFSRNILFRLESISKSARLLAAREPLTAAVEGDDEIAQLDSALHRTGDILAYARRKELVVLDNAATVICTLDRRLKFVAVNDTARRFWHYDEDQLLFLSLLTLVKEDAADQTREQFQRIADGGGQGSLETEIRCRDKSFRTCQWIVNWSADKGQYYCVVHDVTELRSIERFKQQLLSIVSHDLRAPLTAVGISLSLLLEGKRGPISEETRKELEKRQHTVNRLMQLVNDLLQLEKFASGTVVLDTDCISAHGLFAEAKQTLESLARRANVTIQGPVGDAAVLGDERRLIRVVTNLLSNAIKFSPSGGTVLLSIVSVINPADNKRYVELHVTDQGPGIAPEDQALVFEKFIRPAPPVPTQLA